MNNWPPIVTDLDSTLEGELELTRQFQADVYKGAKGKWGKEATDDIREISSDCGGSGKDVLEINFFFDQNSINHCIIPVLLMTE